MSLTLPGSGAGAFPRFRDSLRLGFAALGAMARTFANRQAALRVSDLPDHLLADVGLKRDDVHAALQTSWRTDPTYLMARSARENRCKR